MLEPLKDQEIQDLLHLVDPSTSSKDYALVSLAQEVLRRRDGVKAMHAWHATLRNAHDALRRLQHAADQVRSASQRLNLFIELWNEAETRCAEIQDAEERQQKEGTS